MMAFSSVYRSSIVKVGTGASAFWIDRYEASVWSNRDGTGTQYGASPDGGDGDNPTESEQHDPAQHLRPPVRSPKQVNCVKLLLGSFAGPPPVCLCY